jgi:hypothetical protein
MALYYSSDHCLGSPSCNVFLIFLNAVTKQFILSGTTSIRLPQCFEIVMLRRIVAYAFVVIFGIPSISFSTIQLINYWSLSIGSAAIAAVPLILLGLQKELKFKKIRLILRSQSVVLLSAAFLHNELKDLTRTLERGLNTPLSVALSK